MLCDTGTVSAAEVSRAFELTGTQTEVLLEVLAALSLCNNPTSSAAHAHGGTASASVAPTSVPAPPIGQERVFMHELSMLLLAQVEGGRGRGKGCLCVMVSWSKRGSPCCCC